MANDTQKNSELPLVAKVTGTSISLVRKVSIGNRQNEQISWAINRAQELKAELSIQLAKEYQQKFG